MFFPQENMIIVTFLRELWERTSKSNIFFFFFLSIHHLNLDTDERTQRRLYSRALSKESDLFLQKISSSLNLCLSLSIFVSLSLSHIHTHTLRLVCNIELFFLAYCSYFFSQKHQQWFHKLYPLLFPFLLSCSSISIASMNRILPLFPFLSLTS